MHRPLASILLLLATTALLAGCGSGSTPDLNAGPSVSSVVPASGGVAGGTPLVIQGTGLRNPQAGTYQVLVGNQPATDVVVVSDTEVQCKAPPNAAGPAAVTVVTIEGEGTVPGAFTYYPGPTITSITPNNGTRFGNVEVTIVGTGFTNNDPGVTLPLIDLKALVNPVVVDDTTITGLTPTSWLETAKDVTVQNRNGKATLPGGFVYTGPLPLIYSLTPTDGPRGGGTSVTITGDWFTVAAGALTVRFGSVSVFGFRVDDQHLTCTTPFSPVVGLVDVAVSNGNGESTLPDGFFFINTPTPTSIDPTSGPIGGGTSVTINGSGFFGNGANTVRFGAVAATSVVVVNDNMITCVAPGGSSLGAVDVSVSNSAGLGTLSGAYTYTLPPFWWEETFGTASSSPGDFSLNTVSLPNGFPFFGTNWNSVYVTSDGHIDFGAYHSSYSTSHTLFSFPHISTHACDGYTSAANNIYWTNHISGRTIITYDNVAEYSTLGANSVQIHLLGSGIFAILYQNATFFFPGYYNPYALVAVNPGGGSSVPVDWSAGSHSGGPTDALNEQFSGTTDLANSYIVFWPNSSGGYESMYTSGVPTDPDP